mmetsp:Transcript_4301/g.8728  ORF Transcript_4301/g.8728 Transcript_4301/m.8728 type:complete len:188 (-) Transcript_4301:13-576(-)
MEADVHWILRFSFWVLSLSLPNVVRSQYLWTAAPEWSVGPSGRKGMTATTIDGSVYTFGGCAPEGGCFNDVFVLDGASFEWRQPALKGTPPSARGGHSAVLVNSDILIFGGTDGKEAFNDVWKLDVLAGRWSKGVLPSLQAEMNALPPATANAHANTAPNSTSALAQQKAGGVGFLQQQGGEGEGGL